jgi:glycosyltransferase involved in cell wall biosynthesis
VLDVRQAPGLRSIAFIGNALPRRCGIATFTTDLQQAVAGTEPHIRTAIVAITDAGESYAYPPSVGFSVAEERLGDYVEAAAFLNAGGFDAVSLQHEFGIFGGSAGAHILATLERLTMPIVTTLHTVLAEPTAAQSHVMDGLIEASSGLVVMAEKGRELLRTVYRAPPSRIEVIAHGVPDFPFVEPGEAKLELGYAGRPVILTFGLLSPNKGIEVMIEAMPAILRHCPDAVYVVLGATHPMLVRRDGEAYRQQLADRVRTLQLDAHVVFLDQFVDRATLLRFIAMCDVYVTPYLNEQQMTSGTLSYSFGLGKAVVSTPYWHARELLADGRGVLVPFGDVAAIGDAVANLLTDGRRRQAMRRRAYADSRTMTWEQTARRHLAACERAWLAPHGARAYRRQADPGGDARLGRALPEMQLGHLLAMSDDTGLMQHAVHTVPDRAHGYCIDDNARALLLAGALNTPGEQRLPDATTARFAGFIQHAWNPDRGRFRNFMGFDRRWLEECGSEDSHGRTLWALGVCARDDAGAARRQWAAGLFAAALPEAVCFRSPRAMAFTLLGLDGYCAVKPGDDVAGDARTRLADRLLALLGTVETHAWTWFEEGLSYDNARLPQALIATGHATGAPALVAAGLRTLRWLMTRQTAPSGVFRPVGTAGFATQGRAAPESFDQQPVEAAATISACLAALRVDDDTTWRDQAMQAFAWFHGSNDLALPLVDLESGSCRDGLHPDRVNANCGGESVVSYLLGLAELRRLAWLGGQWPEELARSMPRAPSSEVAHASAP